MINLTLMNFCSTTKTVGFGLSFKCAIKMYLFVSCNVAASDTPSSLSLYYSILYKSCSQSLPILKGRQMELASKKEGKYLGPAWRYFCQFLYLIAAFENACFLFSDSIFDLTFIYN